MTWTNRLWTVLVPIALLPFNGAHAQGETIDPLGSRWEAGARKQMERATELNEHFFYEYLPQVLPIMDDFSVDRRRLLWAQGADADVTLIETIMRLEVDGVSTPDMVFMTDTTWYFIIDSITPDSFSLVQDPLPSVQLQLRNVTIFPVSEQTITAWPAYNVIDTVQRPLPDTLHQEPDLVQDSMLVYTVAANTDTYIMNGVPQPLVLWQEDDAHVNGNYPIDPPTVGVATFDGLDRTGYPYNFSIPTAWGLADKLTSVPIDLAYPASDSIYFSFFFQPQGRSGDDQVQAIDSLVVEFYAPDDQAWERVWSTPYTPLAPFEQVMIPITDPKFLKSEFQLRFMNYATLSGDLDHWHVDYVRLGRQRAFDDTVLVDVAYMMPESSILQTYTSVPFSKFIQAPTSYMAQSVTQLQRNLDVNDRFVTYGMQVGPRAGPVTDVFSHGTNTSNNAASIFPSGHTIASAPTNYVFDSGDEECDAFFKVQFFTNTTPDINRYNDTITHIQELSNYYAYDDGSAEAGYNLNAAGARLAYRFDMVGGDSLRAVRMYFDPIFEDPQSGSFLITVWSSLDEENIIHQNFSFSSPEYRQHGPDKYVEYALDSTIWVEGTFYIGWVQTTATKMNLGFDRNRNNQDKIFYRVAGGFQQTSFEGSLMMRPVFVACSDPFLAIEQLDAASQDLLLYPNPASDRFHVRWAGGPLPPGARMTVHDAMGRLMLDNRAVYDLPIDVTFLSSGFHVVRLLDPDDHLLGVSRLIIQR